MEVAVVSRKADICTLCNCVAAKYTCPRCNIPYCSIDCYKSTSHLNCSEEFYKEWIETEMKCQSNDPERRKTMTEILKRIHEQNSNPFEESEDDIDELDEELDSDDDEQVPDLADRIKDVDLDDANELWGVLTDAERQEFEALVRNGEEEKVLPHWVPWWTSKVDKGKLIKEVDENERIEMIERCPKVLDVPYIPAVEKAATTTRFNLLNVLYSYILMVFHYDGDHQKSATEAVSMFLQLCDNIGDNKTFDDEDTAINAVIEKASDHQLMGDDEEHVILDHLRQLVTGPNNDEQSFYISAAVSDLHQLLSQAKKTLSTKKDRSANSLFKKRFKPHIDEQYMNLSKKHMPLYLKKLEYYFNWINKYGRQMLDLKI